ncbi:ShlB/FhaC/HecB family hemolysin secretion/activation protein [Atlantibacter hermannii]|uniref:ShlB/FhaC/HecB family hemolysin secretion/activation protein n=1 Tax=Atlantibacter hermannii TaxID=565 RepID=UPI0022B78475|nr:POTRA domain-containing protein [Atlantibacter hermannii]MCZ7836840.1 ShlB/FhaC/HecB family hemolysin secretion/activation protein [Atlantibacter hermannii]
MKLPLFCVLWGISGMAMADTLPALIDPDNPAMPARTVPGPETGANPASSIRVTQPARKYTPDTPIPVRHIQFIGGTRYPLKSLLAPFRPYAGKTVPLKTIIVLANDITARYKADGYPLSYAWLPDDNFHNGTIKIVLVEGYVAHSNIHSDNPHTAERLKRLSEQIMVEKPLSAARFERYSLLMTRTPETKVDANAQLPTNIYGAAVMRVDAKQPRIWDLSSTLDTRKGQNLAMINGSLSNLTSYGDRLGVATLIPLDDKTEQHYLGLNYQQFLTDDGLSMQLKGSYYREEPKDYTPLLSLPQDITIDVQNTATQYNGGVNFSYPLMLTRQKQIGLTGGFDYTDRRNDYRLRAQGFGQTLDLGTQHQHVRYPALEFGINGYREFEKASASGSATVRQGMDALGADAAPSLGTDVDFTLWKGRIDGAWKVAENWRLSTALDGNWSDNDLPEPERVSYGAQRFGRGYQDGEATGDYGYGGQLELRYLHMRKESQWLATVQPYLLADAARTGFNQPGYRHSKLASVAGGVMLGDMRHYGLTLEAARPVGDKPSDASRRDWRFSLTVTWNFNDLR